MQNNGNCGGCGHCKNCVEKGIIKLVSRDAHLKVTGFKKKTHN